MKTQPPIAPFATANAQRSTPSAEALETRIAPASIAVPATVTFTDANLDVVKVQITGTGGTVDLLDAANHDVVGALNGANLAFVVVKNPTKDFAITFIDTNPGIGDDIVSLGRITGDAGARLPIIKGIFTVASDDTVAYQLTGFVGTDFAPGGGLRILGSLLGDPGSSAVDLDLKTLSKGASVTLRDGIAADASVGVAGVFAGSLNVGGNLAGAVKVGAVNVGAVNVGAVTGTIQAQEISGSVTVQGDFSGRLVVGDPAHLAPASTGPVTIKGSLLAAAVVSGSGDFRLEVGKDAAAGIGVAGNLDLAVTGSLIGANVLVGDNLTLTVGGAIWNSAILAHHEIVAGSKVTRDVKNSSIIGGTGLNLEVGGSVATSKLSGGSDDMSMKVAGRVTRSQFIAGSTIDMETGFGITNSSILPDGDLDLKVGQLPTIVQVAIGDVVHSQIGSKSGNADVTIGGRVMGSRFLAGDDFKLQTGRDLAACDFSSGGNGDLTIGGKLDGSRYISGSNLKATVGGAVIGSALIAGNDLTVSAGIGMSRSRLESTDGSVDATVVGPVAGTVFDSGVNVHLKVSDLPVLTPPGQPTIVRAGSVAPDVLINAVGDVSLDASGKVGARFVAGGDVNIKAGAEFSGSVNAAHQLTIEAPSLKIAGTLGGTALAGKLPAVPIGIVPDQGVNPIPRKGLRAGGDLVLHTTGNVVAPIIDVGGHVTDFTVGGNFSAPMFVAGNFIAGVTTASATVIGGTVAPSAFIQIGGNVGSIDSAPKLIFAKGFAGRLQIGGSILTDLEFGGAVQSISVAGRIGAAKLGDKIADIIVHGALGSLRSGSLFMRTGANGGNFVDGSGSTITGTLLADGGAPLVEP